MTPPTTPRYALPYGQVDDALMRLDSGVAFGGWAPNIDTLDADGRLFGYHGGFNADGSYTPGGTVAIADDSTRYVQRTWAGVVSADAVLDLVNKIPIAKVTAAGGAITNYADMRESGFWMVRAVLAFLYGGDVGDLPVSDGTGPAILPVDGKPNGYVLTLDDGEAVGMKWDAPAGGSGSGEAAWAKTVLQLHFDGVDTSTTFTDQKGRTVTPSGNAQIDTGDSKFGGASGIFDGTGDYLTVSAHKSFNLPNAFTIDFWVKTSQTGRQYATIIERDNGAFSSGSWSVLFNQATASDGIIYFAHHSYVSDGSPVVKSTTAINNGAWHHVAIVGIGSHVLLFVDGVLEDEKPVSAAPAVNTSSILIGKSVNASREFAGALDELRIVKGQAVWTADFTPPTSAYPDA